MIVGTSAQTPLGAQHGTVSIAPNSHVIVPPRAFSRPPEQYASRLEIEVSPYTLLQLPSPRQRFHAKRPNCSSVAMTRGKRVIYDGPATARVGGHWPNTRPTADIHQPILICAPLIGVLMPQLLAYAGFHIPTPASVRLTVRDQYQLHGLQYAQANV